jgi:hypothetical protein
MSVQNAVLLFEQDLQWEEDVHAPEGIAEVHKIAAANAETKVIVEKTKHMLVFL